MICYKCRLFHGDVNTFDGYCEVDIDTKSRDEECHYPECCVPR